MRKSRFHILKLLATLAVIASVSGLFSLPATAAPANTGAAPRVQAQDVTLCASLLDLDVIGEDGALIGVYADIELPGILRFALIPVLGYDVGATVAANLLAGGCADFMPEPEPVYANASLTVTGPETGTWETYYSDGTFIASGSFTNGVAVDMGAYNVDETFTVVAYADGWEANSTTFTGGGSATLELTQTPPAVLDAVLFVDPAVDGTYTGSCGGSAVDGTFTGGTAVMGQVYEGAYCEVTLSADGYADGSASGYITDDDGDGSGFISGSLGAPEDTVAENVTFAVDAEDGSIPVGAPLSITDSAGGVVFDGTVPDNGLVTTDSLTPDDYTVVVGAFDIYDGATATYTVTAADDGATFTTTVPLAGQTVETGTVTVDVYTCADLDSDVAVWDATPGDDCVASTDTVTVVFTSTDGGLGTSESLDVTGTGSIELPAGTYTVTENGTFSSTSVDVAVDSTSTLTLLRPATPETETFPVTIEANTSDDGSAEGASVTIEEATDDSAQTFMAAAQLAPVTGTIGADNTFSTDLPAGDYIVTVDGTAQGYDVSTSSFTVPTDGPVVVDLLAMPDTGFVSVYNVFCPDLDSVVFNPTTSLDDCDPGAGTFTFYLYGDGTADYEELQVWEDGLGTIELPVGDYQMVVEGTGATFDLTVTADAVTDVTVANPGEAPAPRDGTVNVSAFTCTNIDEVIFSSDSFMTTFALPTHEPACDPGTATLTFYLIGDDTDAHWQVVADPTNSIQLAPGNYEVVEEGTQAHTFVTVYPGDFITLDVQIPAGGEVVPGNSVNIVKFYCDTVTDTEFVTYDLADYSARDELATAPDCVSGAATFTFYLVGDGTADYAQIVVDGAGTIGLEPGTYEVVEEETQAHFTFDVLDGENTLLVVNNPMPENGEVPGGGNGTPEPQKPGKAGEVTELPSTGSGHADSNGVYLMAAAAAAMVAGAGAFIIRRNEAA